MGVVCVTLFVSVVCLRVPTGSHAEWVSGRSFRVRLRPVRSVPPRASRSSAAPAPEEDAHGGRSQSAHPPCSPARSLSGAPQPCRKQGEAGQPRGGTPRGVPGDPRASLGPGPPAPTAPGGQARPPLPAAAPGVPAPPRTTDVHMLREAEAPRLAEGPWPPQPSPAGIVPWRKHHGCSHCCTPTPRMTSTHPVRL